MKKIISAVLFVSMMFLSVAPFSRLCASIPDEEPLISMDFKDAGLKDILKVFSLQSGLNFIASEGVQDRKVTLYLDRVPLKKAMDQIFKANNLTFVMEQDSNIFFVKDYGKPEVEMETRVFYLKYATVSTSSLKEEMASKISPNSTVNNSGSGSSRNTSSSGSSTGKWKTDDDSGITKAVRKILSANGSVMEDFRTNSLIVTDIPSHMGVIVQVIAALDISVPEVMLEVEMLDVSKNAVDKLGVKFSENLATMDTSMVSKYVNMFGSASEGKTLNSSSGTSSGGWSITNWGAGNFGPAILSLFNTQLTLNFLKTLTDTKYLARPKLRTLNNETAEIKITTQEAISASSVQQGQGTASSTTTTTERTETGVTLRVTPQINLDNGEVTMFIQPTVKDAKTSDLLSNVKDPEERSTKSTVRVKDGETVVLGGLIRNQSSEIITKLPVLGDIPILGWVFKQRNKDKGVERELLVFITPHIIKDNSSNVQLAKQEKINIPEREQNVFSGGGRDLSVKAALDNFDK